MEGRPSAKVWGQIYISMARRGEVDEQSLDRQYRHEKVPFLYRTYSGGPETKTDFGIRGEWVIAPWGRLKVNLFTSNWHQHYILDSAERGSTRKIDGMIQIVLGL